MSTSEVVAQVFDLYREHGSESYIGEKVSQLEHATQCAMAAEQAGRPDEVILGAFLHDIGHILPASADDQMYTNGAQFGVKRHEKRGQEFLQSLGLPQVIGDIALGHVSAKRYLCFKDPSYYDQLSEASKVTLVHQGGRMTPDEARQFEQLDSFKLCLQARLWDENAKIENMKMPPIEKYEKMLKRVLDNCNI